MPVTGGAADKFGNRYETLWAIDQLLRIIDGVAVCLILEPLDRDESRGIEFVVSVGDGTSEYWSVKRQTTRASGWTIALLAKGDGDGRGVLSDLLKHVERDSTHCGVFASTLGARNIDELRNHASTKEMFEARLAQSEELKSNFLEYIVPLCGGDADRARTLLLRLRAHAADESQLQERVNFAIRKLLYVTNGSQLDVDTVRGHLANLLLGNIHRQIDRRIILQALALHSIGICEWATEKSVVDRIGQLCDAYCVPLRSEFINGKIVALGRSEQLLTIGRDGIGKRTIVVAKAGGGKSSTLASFVEQLRESRIPVLTIRFDQLPEGILTTRELGEKLRLPESPAMTLAGVATGCPSVLVVDQLDAISSASGRKTELWSLFEELESEVSRVPSMSIVVGCREFDLEHDHRIRKMRTEGRVFEVINLGELSAKQVEMLLVEAGTDPQLVRPALRPILTVPLHLALFLRLSPEMRIGVRNRDELFGHFWIESERRVDKRLGRKAAWTPVIDRLANWLSENQQLSAPKHVLDDFSADAAAMASEHFLILSENRYRFVHESLFDYAFARRFSARGAHLVDFLLADEQHLFRRAQVRQILAFLRAEDRPRYLQELRSLLSHPKIRFHIKRLVIQWLGFLPDPHIDEWQILQELFSQVMGLREEFLSVASLRPDWFDVFDEAGFFDAALSSDGEKDQQEAIWIMAFSPILEARSVRVSKLIRQYQKSGEPWDFYLTHIYRSGIVFHSRDIFDLFLSHIDDGRLDGARPGMAVNDGWWSLLYQLAENRPDLACEAIAHWFDRRIAVWRTSQEIADASSDRESVREQLKKELNRNGQDWSVVSKACATPLIYVKELLPRIARIACETAKECPSRLMTDPLWCFRSFGEEHFQVHEILFSRLAKCLEEVASTSPTELNSFLEPFQDLPSESIAFLVLRAWTAAPKIYADKIAKYLASDARRLKIGYQMGGSGSFENYVSTEAVRSASSQCSAERFELLERAIIFLQDDWEAKNPQIRGWKQLELLRAMPSSRLSVGARDKLEELNRKFPDARHEEPREIRAGFVGSPIPEAAQAKMSDKHWLGAMRKYAGKANRLNSRTNFLHGEHELGTALMSRAREDSARFVALAERMTDDVPASYFDAIIRGIAESIAAKYKTDPIATEELCERLIRRAHALPNHPCGRALAWLFVKARGIKWRLDVVRVLAWYAANDPDPPEASSVANDEDAFQKTLSNTEEVPMKLDLYMTGMNSVRGGAAEAIGGILFDQPAMFHSLQDVIHSLATDRSAAVRSCAVFVLVATLNIDSAKAIKWFKESVSDRPSVLATPYVQRFIHNAAYRDLLGVWPILEWMLKSSVPDVDSVAAQEICILSLDPSIVVPKLEEVENGTVTFRAAAARVYATNISHETVGAECRRRLTHFFLDPDESIRMQAASAFQHIAKLDTNSQRDLLQAFLNARPGPVALIPVVHALSGSAVQLPDLVCQLAELCVDAYKNDAGDISKGASASGMDLSKLVIRLYAQTSDPGIKSRCLSMIDQMERHHFLGLSDELQRLER